MLSWSLAYHGTAVPLQVSCVLPLLGEFCETEVKAMYLVTFIHVFLFYFVLQQNLLYNLSFS